MKPGTRVCLRCNADQEEYERVHPVRTDVSSSMSSPRSLFVSSPSDRGGREDPEFESKAPTLRRIHMVPFAETLPERFADSIMYEENAKEQYLDEFFATGRKFVELGTRFQIKEVDFKVVCTVPPCSGWVDHTTEVRCMDPPVSALCEMSKLHVLPMDASWETEKKYDPQFLFNEVVKPFFTEEKHVAAEDTFMSNGVQCRIVAGEPASGIVNENTQIYCTGDPVPDLKRLHMLPIYESLPNRDKDITSEEIFSKYLEPYFTGRFRSISSTTDKVCISGVDFKVVASEPETGIVTLNTVIYTTGQPLRADDLRRYQEEQDAEMARQLQQQESRAARLPLGVPGVIPSDELRLRLQAVLRDLPEGDRNRLVVQSLHDQLLMSRQDQLSLLSPFMSRDGLNGFANIYGRGGAPLVNADGASTLEIENLPTRLFNAAQAASKSQEQNTCRVCLSEYEDREELRTLPCFHSYHKECIDHWLVKSKKCPICKHAMA